MAHARRVPASEPRREALLPGQSREKPPLSCARSAPLSHSRFGLVSFISRVSFLVLYHPGSPPSPIPFSLPKYLPACWRLAALFVPFTFPALGVSQSFSPRFPARDVMSGAAGTVPLRLLPIPAVTGAHVSDRSLLLTPNSAPRPPLARGRPTGRPAAYSSTGCSQRCARPVLCFSRVLFALRPSQNKERETPGKVEGRPAGEWGPRPHSSLSTPQYGRLP